MDKAIQNGEEDRLKKSHLLNITAYIIIKLFSPYLYITTLRFYFYFKGLCDIFFAAAFCPSNISDIASTSLRGVATVHLVGMKKKTPTHKTANSFIVLIYMKYCKKCKGYVSI